MSEQNHDLLSLIGNTTMVELTAFETGLCRLFVKLESSNPGGSIKDRIGLFMIDEAELTNLANPLAHEQTTGPEIWRQMDQRVDAVVCGVGTGGTLTGLSRFFAGQSPNTDMVLADPAGSILVPYIGTGQLSEVGNGWLVEGIGEDSPTVE